MSQTGKNMPAKAKQTAKKTNTRIDYLYRDASNWKYGGNVIVAGKLTFNDLLPYLDEDTYFCPKDVGLPHPGENAPSWPSSDDHVFCELTDLDLAPTSDPVTDVNLTAQELLARFKKASEAGWPAQTESLGEDD
jgi:hypothetical protein